MHIRAVYKNGTALTPKIVVHLREKRSDSLDLIREGRSSNQAVKWKKRPALDGMPFAGSGGAMLCHLNKRKSSLSSQKGFTLIETAVVVTIIGITAALAIPNLVQMYARYELYQATTSLYNRFMLARSAAVSRNAMIVGTPSNLPTGQGQVVFTAPFGTELLPLNVTLSLFPPPPQTIGFTPRGLSTSPLATQTLQLSNVRLPGFIYTISLAPSGKVTWCPTQVNPCVLGQ
jgi:type IV fimbrial biogenesis protein FimT